MNFAARGRILLLFLDGAGMRRLLILLCAVCGTAAGADIEVPFDFLHNQVVLHVTIAGQGPFNFLLDSGTYASTVDLGLARKLRLPMGNKRRPVVGAGERQVEARETVCEHLRIGDLEVERLRATVIDLDGMSREMGRPLGGVLGYGFLSSRIVQIDYFRRRVRFCDRSPFAPSPRPPDTSRRVVFPMQFRAGLILPVLEDCLVNGERIPVTLDTGSSLGLILFPAAIARLGLEKLAREGIPLTAAGYRGTARLAKGWVRSVVLKTIDLGAIEVAYVNDENHVGAALERRGGNLGNAVLQDFVLTLDYRNRVVVLESVAE
jgi:hypothetical protein